jgi:hypothetical protein
MLNTHFNSVTILHECSFENHKIQSLAFEVLIATSCIVAYVAYVLMTQERRLFGTFHDTTLFQVILFDATVRLATGVVEL